MTYADPNVHIMSLSLLLDALLNAERDDVRFALVVWYHQGDGLNAVVSNDRNDAKVVRMLEEAKSRISEGIIHQTAGNA